MKTKLDGLIAASYTPMNEDGSIRLESIPAMVDHLEAAGVSGVFVCGSTGEGLNLTLAERKQVASAYVEAAHARLKTIVHVGHHCLEDSCELARHAAEIGADCFSSLAPCYYPIGDARTLLDTVAKIAASVPEMPFYYYHIPPLTGIELDLHAFLEMADNSIPNLAGVKYTSFRADEFRRCLSSFGTRYDMVWGFDEMMLAALPMGAKAFIGSTFNLAAPLYMELIEHFNAGRMQEAQILQAMAIEMIHAINSAPFHPAMKGLLSRTGIPMGPARLPLSNPAPEAIDLIWQRIGEIGIVEKCGL